MRLPLTLLAAYFLWREWEVLEAARDALRIAVHVSIQVWRMREEEKVLEAAFPDYADYRGRTARLIPGVY